MASYVGALMVYFDDLPCALWRGEQVRNRKVIVLYGRYDKLTELQIDPVASLLNTLCLKLLR